MRRIAAGLALAVLFTIANRGAFEGYFSGDDLDNLSWATIAETRGFLADWVSLRFSETNTRATGALFYQFAGRAFGLDFARYVPWLMGIHLLNCVLLGWLAKRRGAGEPGAWAAAVIWGFHAGVLEAWWKPMYVFDLLCGTFCLATWHLFAAGRTWWALPFFLIAYRAKEVAAFLPVALALDNWRAVWPLALVSLNFVAQAARVNAGRDNDYTLRFSLDSLRVTAPFYGKALFFHKWGALLALGLGWFWRERQLWLGVAGSLAMLAPLLFLPRRLFSVYWYVPMIPLALGIAFALAKAPRWALAAGLSVWLAFSFGTLREKRKAELALAHENRAYVEQLATFYALRPFGNQAFLEGRPPGLPDYGIRGAMNLIRQGRDFELLQPEIEAQRRRAMSEDIVTLQWFRPTQTLSLAAHRYGEARRSSLDMGETSSAWQLREGWLDRTGNFRWASERATVALFVGTEARQLVIRFNVGPEFIQAAGKARTLVAVNGVEVGAAEFTAVGTPELRWPLPPKAQGEVEVTLSSTPGMSVKGFNKRLGIGVLQMRVEP